MLNLGHDEIIDTVADRINELALAGDPIPLTLYYHGLVLGIDVQAIINNHKEAE